MEATNNGMSGSTNGTPPQSFTGAHLMGPGPLIRHGTPDQYEARNKREREEFQARQREALTDVAPVVEKVRVRLDQGFPFVRVVSESGVKAAHLEALLRGDLPRDDFRGWSFECVTVAAAALSAWLDESRADDDTDDTYIPTPIGEEILNLVERGRARKSLAIVVGGFGVGKTTAAIAAVAANPRGPGRPGVVRIEISEADRTINALLCRF